MPTTHAVFRNRPQRDFTTIRNAALRDPEISLKAKGCLALMLSFPDNWRFRMSHLVQLSTDGRDALRTAISELIARGYVRRFGVRTDDGNFNGNEYIVSDETFTADGFSGYGEPGVGEPDATNTDGKKTEVTKELPTSANADTALRDFVETLRATWNEHCGELASSRIVSKSSTRLAREFLKRQGGDQDKALAIFRDGMTAVTNDPWWLGNRATTRHGTPVKRQGPPYGIENYLRMVEEKFNAAMETPAAADKANRTPAAGERWNTRIGIVDVDAIHTLTAVRTGATAVDVNTYDVTVHLPKMQTDDNGDWLPHHATGAHITLTGDDFNYLWSTGPDGRRQE